MDRLNSSVAIGGPDPVRGAMPSFKRAWTSQPEHIRSHTPAPILPRQAAAPLSQEIRIFSLGRFSLLKQQGEVRVSGKGQRKSLELLKTIIALGGREIGETRINEALWPDSEGDVAHTAFAVTLHRLRKLIGADALVLIDGRLTLDANYCWVDTWQCERLIGEIKAATHSGRGDHHTLMSKVGELLSLYHGPFLGHEDEQAWFLSYRTRLHNKFQRCLIGVCHYLETHKQAHSAIEIYEHCLQVDDLFEQAYSRLMRCYLQLGRHVEALMTYQRCREVLTAHLGIGPSEEMHALYKTILKCA